MGKISKKKQAALAARAVQCALQREKKAIKAQTEADLSENQIDNESPPEDETENQSPSKDETENLSNIIKLPEKPKKAERRYVDPLASIRGKDIVKRRTDKEIARKIVLKQKLVHANREKAKKALTSVVHSCAAESSNDKKTCENDEKMETDMIDVETSSNLTNDVTCENNAAMETDIMNFKTSSNLCDVTSASGFTYLPKTSPRSKPANPNSIYKKRKILQTQLDKQMPGYHIVKKVDQSLKEDAKLIKKGKFSRNHINMLSKSKKVPSYPTVMKHVNAKLPNVPQYHIPDTEKRKNVIYLKFYDLLFARLQNMKHIPSRRLRITVGADTGEKITKVTMNINDNKHPQSCYNYSTFIVYEGDDSWANLVDILVTVEEDINKILKEGMEINGVKYYFKFFLTGDLKFLCTVLGCQGGSSKKFCCFCKTDKYMEEGESRSVEEIQTNFANVQTELQSSKKKENLIKQKNNSVCAAPLLPSIPLENICPPALHCCMALCNKVRLFSKSLKFDEFIKDLNIKPIQGRDEYNGNACRKILEKFRKRSDEYDGPNKSLFITIANIEIYAKAEELKEPEINLLENLIKELKDQLQLIPEFSIGNKIHCILFHLIPFIRREKSWGIFSEQGLEAIHAKFTEFEKRKFSKKFDKMKYALFEMMKITFMEEI